MSEHPISYTMVINFHADGVSVSFTGESVEFATDKDKFVRPRHLRIVSQVHSVMRQYIENNQNTQVK